MLLSAHPISGRNGSSSGSSRELSGPLSRDILVSHRAHHPPRALTAQPRSSTHPLSLLPDLPRSRVAALFPDSSVSTRIPAPPPRSEHSMPLKLSVSRRASTFYCDPKLGSTLTSLILNCHSAESSRPSDVIERPAEAASVYSSPNDSASSIFRSLLPVSYRPLTSSPQLAK